MTIGMVGPALTALGTVLAIIRPTIAGRWGGEDTPRQERRLQARYFTGIALIVIGTVLQLWQAQH